MRSCQEEVTVDAVGRLILAQKLKVDKSREQGIVATDQVEATVMTSATCVKCLAQILSGFATGDKVCVIPELVENAARLDVSST